MKCRICNEEKLSKEFPREPVTENCDHPALYCLQCVIEKVGQKPNCPYINCGVAVVNSSTVVEQCRTELEHLYPPVQPCDAEYELDNSATTKIILVTTLTGDSTSFPFDPQMSVADLKMKILSKLNVAPDKQQLMYNETILEDYISGAPAKLSNYGVKPFATLHLMVLLYAIPQHFNHVIFDLFWGYPSHGLDYLDASCLIFSGKSFVNTVDFQKRNVYSNQCIYHSGDVMNDAQRKGHHTIEVRLKDLPSNITHLYFTLAAWNSPTIAHFPNPSLKFFEASDKSKDLCKTSFHQAHNSQAVIMCSVSRQAGSGAWRIFECGKLSAGNANNYKPLIATIQTL